MKKKNYFYPILSIVGLLCINACNSPTNPPHVHTPKEAVIENEIAATCEVNGSYDEVIYCETCEEEISRVSHTTQALGHDYQDPTYTWSSDYSTCTAEIKCSRNSEHVISETVESEATIEYEATCQYMGRGSFVATFTDEHFEQQRVDNVFIPRKPHEFGEPSYLWVWENNAYTKCYGTRNCLHCTVSSTLTGTVTSEIIKEASESEDGILRYTATFNSENIGPAHKDVPIPHLGEYLGRYPIRNAETNTFTYGLYPQTVVNDVDLIASLNTILSPDENGWYLYENEYYVKYEATPKYDRYQFMNGESIESGREYWFKCEPIEWNILYDYSDSSDLTSKYVLDAHRFNEGFTGMKNWKYANNYEASEVRSWLNGEFYNQAFALNDHYLSKHYVYNSKQTTDNANGKYESENTEDKVFILSYQECIAKSWGFDTNPGQLDLARRALATDYARARGLRIKDDNVQGPYGLGYYITRSPYNGNTSTDLYERYVWYVKPFGNMVGTECYVGWTDMGVRPSIELHPGQPIE